jgi:hypothetical protein
MMVFVFNVMQKLYEWAQNPNIKTLMIFEILKALAGIIGFGLLIFKILT